MKQITTLFLIIFGIIFVNIAPALAATGNITNLVFTTPLQTVTPATISEKITVQTQNSGGTSEKVSETNDVTFTSTSGTGQFLNEDGNAVSTTMNNGWDSRNFYYKDSTAGTYTLAVSIKGRTTGTTFSASQQIIIGNSQSNTATSTQSTSSTGAASTSSTSNTTASQSSGTSQNISAHTSQVSVSGFADTLDFKANAGRERIASVNAPLEFMAETHDMPATYLATSYQWSFGDGTSESGKSVHHTYAFSGDYNVVLNVSVGDSRAVSRTHVKVVAPQIAITDVKRGEGGFVEIKNDSPYEVNLQNWRLSSVNAGQTGKNDFYFAVDTIMSPHSVIKFPIAFAEGKNPVMFFYPNGVLVFGTGVFAIADNADDQAVAERRMDAEERTRAYLSALAHPPSEEDVVISEENFNSSSTEDLAIGQAGTGASTTVQNADQTASLIEAIKAAKKDEGILSSILSLPSKTLDFLGRIFSK